MDPCDEIRDALQLFRYENVFRTYQTFLNHDFRSPNANMAAVLPAKKTNIQDFLFCVYLCFFSI